MRAKQSLDFCWQKLWSKRFWCWYIGKYKHTFCTDPSNVAIKHLWQRYVTERGYFDFLYQCILGNYSLYMFNIFICDRPVLDDNISQQIHWSAYFRQRFDINRFCNNLVLFWNVHTISSNECLCSSTVGFTVPPATSPDSPSWMATPNPPNFTGAEFSLDASSTQWGWEQVVIGEKTHDLMVFFC